MDDKSLVQRGISQKLDIIQSTIARGHHSQGLPKSKMQFLPKVICTSVLASQWYKHCTYQQDQSSYRTFNINPKTIKCVEVMVQSIISFWSDTECSAQKQSFTKHTAATLTVANDIRMRDVFILLPSVLQPHHTFNWINQNHFRMNAYVTLP